MGGGKGTGPGLGQTRLPDVAPSPAVRRAHKGKLLPAFRPRFPPL